MNRKMLFNNQIRIFPSILIIGFLVITGCKPEGQASSVPPSPLEPQQPQSWIDAPLSESHIPLAPYEIIFHVSGLPDVALGELLINQQVTALLEVDNPSTKLATLRYLWEPSEAGKYIIHTRARTLDGEWGPYGSAVVYIDPVETPLSTPTPTPTPTPEPEQNAGISNIQASPNQVKIGNCQPNQVTISAHAFAPAGIKSLSVFYRFSDNSGNLTGWENETLAATGDGNYQKSINMTTAALTLGFTSQKGTFIYQLIIEDNNKDLIRSEVLRDIFVTRCQDFLLPFPPLVTKVPEYPIIIITPTVPRIK